MLFWRSSEERKSLILAQIQSLLIKSIMIYDFKSSIFSHFGFGNKDIQIRLFT
jgi:hypothetical protein